MTPPPPPTPSRSRVPERVFLSYSRKDLEWLDRVRVQLAPLVDAGTVELWHDRGDIEPGDAFNRSIAEAIDTSSAAVLLVSPDFQASEFIKANELPRLRRASDAGELRLFWIPVGHCVLADKPGQTYHTAGDPSRPWETCERGEANRVLADLASRLEQPRRRGPSAGRGGTGTDREGSRRAEAKGGSESESPCCGGEATGGEGKSDAASRVRSTARRD